MMHISLILLKLIMGRHLINGFYHLWLQVYIPSCAGIWDGLTFLHFFCPHAGGWIATGYPVWSQILSIISRNWACCKRCSAYYGTLARFFRGQSEIHKIVHHTKFPLYYIEFIHTHTLSLHAHAYVQQSWIQPTDSCSWWCLPKHSWGFISVSFF